MKPSLSLLIGTALLLAVWNAQGQISTLSYDTPSYVDFEFGELRVGEAEQELLVYVYRTGDFRKMASVDFVTEGDTASEGADFAASGGTLVFQPGESFKTIKIGITSDTDVEDDETFWIKLSSNNGETVVVRESTYVWIENATVPIGVPELAIRPHSGSIVLSWVANGIDCALERSVSCVAGGSWEEVPAVVTLNGNQNEVIEPLDGTFYFYRLRTR